MTLLKKCFMLFLLTANITMAQTQGDKNINYELYKKEDNSESLPEKVMHAEPLYIDLIRDLGARKGEKEWNVGLGLTDKQKYDEYEALIEYEWAPADRLGLEIELPFSLYYTDGNKAPSNKLNSLKMATQYTFFVSGKIKTSAAIGYIHEFELTDFNRYSNSTLFTGNIYNPFFIVAKQWLHKFHTLLYAGPQFIHHFKHDSLHTIWQINSNIHYMIPGTRNFVGIEFNKELTSIDFDMTLRPQMRVGITDNFLVGIVIGIPISRENERFSTFLRLIYEP